MTRTRPSQQPWDLLVIGGGTAGIVAAKTAAQLGASVLLVESHRTGGDCLWTGCVPSKALLAAAHVAAVARSGQTKGVEVSEVKVDFSAVMGHVHEAIGTSAPVDSAEALIEAGVEVMHGRARFTAPGRAQVGETELAFRQAVIATGAAPAVPGITGLDSAPHLTSDTVWELETLPSRLVVLGGGSIGCELGQAFTRLGSHVTVVEGAPRLLPREDPDAASVVHEVMTGEGTEVLTGVSVTGAEAHADPEDPYVTGCLRLDDGRLLPYSHLLVAVGRAPRTRDLGLETVGVEVGDRGFLKVDSMLRTTNKRIWAAGDLTGHPQFTHTAGGHGSLAASNAVLGVRRKVDLSAVPRVTYTHPEVAAVGVTTDDPPDGLRVLTWRHTHVDRAVTEGETGGFTKLTVDGRGRILGATVVGPRAGETLGELTVAVTQGLRTRDLAGVTHAYPTWNDGPWNATVADVREQLQRPGTRRALATLARTRRWWVTHRAG